MYHHQAMCQNDKEEFRHTMKQEIDLQMANGNFEIVHKSKVPQDATIIPAVWQMRQKRNLTTRAVKKYKARLNVDRSRQVKGRDYQHTYTPVASWPAIRLLMVLTAIYSWHTVQLDYVSAYPQAPVERTLYMKIPKGCQISGGTSKDHVLRLKKNVY